MPLGREGEVADAIRGAIVFNLWFFISSLTIRWIHFTFFNQRQNHRATTPELNAKDISTGNHVIPPDLAFGQAKIYYDARTDAFLSGAMKVRKQ